MHLLALYMMFTIFAGETKFISSKSQYKQQNKNMNTTKKDNVSVKVLIDAISRAEKELESLNAVSSRITDRAYFIYNLIFTVITLLVGVLFKTSDFKIIMFIAAIILAFIYIAAMLYSVIKPRINYFPGDTPSEILEEKGEFNYYDNLKNRYQFKIEKVAKANIERSKTYNKVLLSLYIIAVIASFCIVLHKTL